MISTTIPGKVSRGRLSRARKPKASDEDTARNLGQVVVNCARPSLLGNPFKEGEDGSREEVVALHRQFLRVVLASRGIGGKSKGDQIRERLEALRAEYLAGREVVLLCYCLEGTPCHTDNYKEFIERGMLEVTRA